ncbi:MAG: hypothetical protein C6H99_00045 [Epsilonproteobacteria bacterium]|nr:hypothetical protein [Campylobacterota bacterium]NPA65231.1 hypothetical protein [Campylobacterota bacterium]
MNSYSIQFETEAEFVEFKKLFFEKELAKIAKKEDRLKKQLKELRQTKDEILEEFSQFKKEYPSYFRRGRKKKNA